MTDKPSVEGSRLQELVYELRIEEVMRRTVITIPPQASLRAFKELLRQERISGTPVLEDGKLVGIISLEDLIKVLEEGKLDAPVSEKMTRQVETLYADEPVTQAVNRMAHFGFGRFPVVDRSGKLVGILTRGDIIRGLLKRLEVDYHEEEIQRYRASHIFEDIVSDRTSLILRYHVRARDFTHGGDASSRIKRSMARLGGNPAITRRVGVAAFEAEMNLLIHTDHGGEMVVEMQPDQVRITVTDDGPGIPDVEEAMRPGFSTAPEWIREMGFGAGMGLLNIRKCAYGMELRSKLGEGTVLEIWFHVTSPAPLENGEEDLL